MAMSGAQVATYGAGLRKEARRGRAVLHQFALWISVGWVGLIVLVGIFAHQIAPYDPLNQELTNTYAGPSAQHLLGTDDLGRDVFSRLVIGTQPVLEGMVVVLVVTFTVGIAWGLIAGFMGGIVDLLLMRVADVFLVLPTIIIAIAIVLTIGPGPAGLFAMIALAISFSPGIARFMRGQVLVVKDRDYVTVTRMYGLPVRHRLLRHIFPNAFAPISIQLPLFAGITVGLSVLLAFLGIGTTPPYPSWGQDLNEGFQHILINPSAVFAPSAVIVLLTLAIFRVGDWFSDRVTAAN
ncbi:MAG: ABC transporter permease [Candidatus Dormibacteraeota bacterium]|nr:ABC transporter permease [Candidatus Dormibacteraeota bacterium]